MKNQPVEQDTSNSFILKIWTEETTAKGEPVSWRGSISHVPDGTRRYFMDLQTMADFVGDFIDSMGGDAGLAYHMRKVVRRWQRTFHARFWNNKLF